MTRSRRRFLDSIMGRSQPARPDLDAIFGLPSAAITLSAALGYDPTGSGAVAFRVPEGRAFSEVQGEVEALLAASGNPAVEVSRDQYGYTWVVLVTDPPDVAGLVTNLHAVNLTLQDTGWGPQLLCAMVGFRGPEGRTLGMVYLFKQGSFYPFAPTSDASQARDTMLELQIRDLVRDDLVIEKDLSRWFPIWGAPGL
jgi:PspA associated protein B